MTEWIYKADVSEEDRTNVFERGHEYIVDLFTFSATTKCAITPTLAVGISLRSKCKKV